MTTAMLTVRQAAERLNVSVGLVYALCARGILEHERYGIGRGTIRIPEDAVAAYREAARSVGARLRPGASGRGVFRQLDPARLAQAWRRRGAL